MKRSIKIIILSILILMITLAPTLVLARTAEEYFELTDSQMQQLMPSEIADAIEKLDKALQNLAQGSIVGSQGQADKIKQYKDKKAKYEGLMTAEYFYNLADNRIKELTLSELNKAKSMLQTAIQSMGQGTLAQGQKETKEKYEAKLKKYQDEINYRSSDDYYLNLSTSELNNMDRDTIKKIVKQLKTTYNTLCSGNRQGTNDEKIRIYKEVFKRYNNRLTNSNKIDYYMDYMSDIDHLNKNLNDMTYDELYAAESNLNWCKNRNEIAPYTESEVTQQIKIYSKARQNTKLSDAERAANDEEYRNTLTTQQLRNYLYIIKDKIEELEAERDACKTNDEKQQYQVTITSYESKRKILNEAIKVREKEELADTIIKAAETLGKARQLSTSTLEYYKTEGEELMSSDIMTGKKIALQTPLANIKIVLKERAVSEAVVDYKDYTPSQPEDYDKAISITGTILTIVRNIGIIVAVISLSLIGIKYIFGSAEEKAEYKKTLVPFTIGLILFAAVVSLVSFVFTIVNGLL